MKIEKLVIYGFGRHENRVIEVTSPIAVFYGLNEAGKTTIQQFILQILFGFTARSRTHQRYEPKAGGKYGGRLHIRDGLDRKVVVERLAGKSAGDVTVWFEDGQSGGETELKELLNGYDRSSFEAIYSFSVHELQHLDDMTEEELTRSLLASGTAGIDQASRMEGALEKEMGELFKKAGKLPLINRLTEELRALEKELKELKKRAETFRPATERLEAIKRRLGEMDEEERKLEHQLKAYEKWQQAMPLLERKEELLPLVKLVNTLHFPEEGVRQYERLSDQLHEAEAEMAFLESELARLGGTEDKPEMQALSWLVANEAEWHELSTSFNAKSEERQRLEDEQNRLLKLCGLDQAAALQADVSLSREQRLKQVLALVREAEEEQAFLRRRKDEERQQLQQAEQRLKAYLEAEPPEEQREQAEHWAEVAPQLARSKAQQQRQANADSNGRLAWTLLSALGAVGLIVSIVSQDLLIGVLSLVAAAAAVWLWLRSRTAEPASVEDSLSAFAGKEAEYEALAIRLAEYDKGLDERLDAVEDSKRKLAGLKETANVDAFRDYRSLVASIGFPEGTPPDTALVLFEKLREVHAVSGRLSRLGQELSAMEKKRHRWLESVQQACGKPVTPETLMPILKAEWEKRQQVLRRLEKEDEKRQALSEQARKCQERLMKFSQAQAALFERADVADRDGFYRAAKNMQQAEAAREELKLIESQLESIGAVEKPQEAKDPARFVEGLGEALSRLRQQRKALVTEQAQKLQETRHLISDEGLAQKLQAFEEKKAEFQQAAKNWAVNRVIVEAFKQTMEELKETKLPAVLERSEAYFHRLTGGEYTGLMLNGQGNFEALRQDGMRFRIIELSQATKEQAYLALRFALASSLKQSNPFPILMDDPFVHFDRRRSLQVIKLVEELQADHQFIYFTCHDAMQHAWPDAQLIDVANPERSIRA